MTVTKKRQIKIQLQLILILHNLEFFVQIIIIYIALKPLLLKKLISIW